VSELAFQDQGSVHHCHGCGAANEKGLRLKSYWDGEEAVARWRAAPHYCGGSPDHRYANRLPLLESSNRPRLSRRRPRHWQRTADRLCDGQFEHYLFETDAA